MSEHATENAGRFELTILVVPADIDQLGHVNNIVYLRWVQDVAVAHWTVAASEEDQQRFLWVVLRHEIDYKQPALAGEKLIARTWVGEATGLKYERHTEFIRASDGGLVARARTIWCPIDRVTGRPTPVSTAVRARFSSQPL
jgi:acyl-CoA thioester hydrolase